VIALVAVSEVHVANAEQAFVADPRVHVVKGEEVELLGSLLYP
jgi:hypothetical protein